MNDGLAMSAACVFLHQSDHINIRMDDTVAFYQQMTAFRSVIFRYSNLCVYLCSNNYLHVYLYSNNYLLSSCTLATLLHVYMYTTTVLTSTLMNNIRFQLLKIYSSNGSFLVHDTSDSVYCNNSIQFGFYCKVMTNV